MRFNVAELILLSGMVVPIVGIATLFGLVSGRWARRMGYSGTWEYLRAIPRSDEERRDAADLTMKGVALCLLGILSPPVVLVGVVPLFYGGRKVIWTLLGLGWIDDSQQPGA